MSSMVGTISWMESNAAPWSAMMGNTGPAPTRHPSLFVGRRRVPPKLWGLWRNGDPPCAVRHEDNVEGLIELRHFFVGVCLKVHRAGETSNVLVARVVHHGEQVEESCPGDVVGHGGVFLSSSSATRLLMMRGCGGNDDNNNPLSKRG